MQNRQASKTRFKRFLAGGHAMPPVYCIRAFVNARKRLAAGYGLRMPNYKTQSEVPTWQKA